MTLFDSTQCTYDAVRLSIVCANLPYMQLERDVCPLPGLRLRRAQLSRESNYLARGRIRRFESFMPSQQLVFNSPMQSSFDLVKVVMTRPQVFNTACGLPT
jgi:hypothetical protein